MKENRDLLFGLVLGVIVGIHYGAHFVPHMMLVYVFAVVLGLPTIKKILR